MTEITLTYKGVTIMETFDHPLTQQSYMDHMNRWFNIIDERVDTVVAKCKGGEVIIAVNATEPTERMINTAQSTPDSQAVATLKNYLNRPTS